MLMSHGEHRESFKQRRKSEKKRERRRSSGNPQTRESLAVLAQLMLPALIEENPPPDDQIATVTNINNRKISQTRRPGNRLLQRANFHMRKGAAGVWDIAGRAQAIGRRKVEQLQQKPPLWMVILHRAYHKYGLKHLVLILVFVLYCTLGGLIFWLIEEPYQSDLKNTWEERIKENRTARVNEMMKNMFNNSDYLIYIKGNTTNRLHEFLNKELSVYENQLGVKWSQQKNGLGFLECNFVCWHNLYNNWLWTHLPNDRFWENYHNGFCTFWNSTDVIGSSGLWCCTKQPIDEMREIEEQERKDLDIFDLPLPVGISLIVIWIFICSFVLSIMDPNWTILESFYFFFTSLSTVGLGDLVPASPKLLLTLFGFILVGLSLVSMVINLLQMKMKKTYETGNQEGLNSRKVTASLGIIQCFEEEEKKADQSERSLSRSTQTSLSLPGVKQVVLRSDGVHWINTSTSSPTKSPDEVTHLVEHESGLRVCEQIGDNNNDEDYSENDSMLYETDVLLEVAESCSDVEKGADFDSSLSH
ncbi:unnamed protein product [Caenorhabditis angaria]|uniref:Potassium channel domain-containing protein n=1 Tax=Caenorhabditis angaria TaxID=860376 RepID=A0A9P1N7U6_9PELO|nr:unnamed protein product [Caenorhabditis angaria]